MNRASRISRMVREKDARTRSCRITSTKGIMSSHFLSMHLTLEIPFSSIWLLKIDGHWLGRFYGGDFPRTLGNFDGKDAGAGSDIQDGYIFIQVESPGDLFRLVVQFFSLERIPVILARDLEIARCAVFSNSKLIPGGFVDFFFPDTVPVDVFQDYTLRQMERQTEVRFVEVSRARIRFLVSRVGVLFSCDSRQKVFAYPQSRKKGGFFCREAIQGFFRPSDS